jgi:hypothetical protein
VGVVLCDIPAGVQLRGKEFDEQRGVGVLHDRVDSTLLVGIVEYR